LVLVVKLAAVLNAEPASTGPIFCGLKGNQSWRRWMAYVTSRVAALKASRAPV
jgi:hypothetical protein